MQIIKIKTLQNGAHENRNEPWRSCCPDGWAVIPDMMEIPSTFPFVNITTKDNVVTNMVAGIMPEPEPETAPPADPMAEIANLKEQLAATQSALDDLILGV